MRYAWISGLALSGLVSFAGAPALAQTAFSTLPEITQAVSSNQNAGAIASRYTFGVRVPQQAKQAMAALVLGFPQQGQNTVGSITLPEPSAISVRNSMGNKVAYQLSKQQNQLVFNFLEPVRPGGEVFIEFYPMENPKKGGRYQFAITAIPYGDQPVKQFVGYGQLNFIAPG